MYIGLAPLRIACRGVCTTSRFHTIPRGCIFGCVSEVPGADLDDMRHYIVCPRFLDIARPWLGAIANCADTIPISSLLLLAVHPSVEAVLCCASFCEALLHAHSQRRVGSVVGPA
eukprot:694283-Pyramimonas_sp.AAC.1